MDVARVSNPAASTLVTRTEGSERDVAEEARESSAQDRSDTRGSDVVDISPAAVQQLEEDQATDNENSYEEIDARQADELAAQSAAQERFAPGDSSSVINQLA